MFGGLNTISRAALVAAALTLGGAAQAADLGGNCCADLEERVAELEATTARKGNRVMSLTVYGQVNQAIVWHNDDTSNDKAVSFRDNDGRTGTRFGFRGSAKISSDLSAGFLLELANDDEKGSGSTVNTRHSMVYLKSASVGQLGLGRTSTATDGIAEVALASVITPFSAEEGADVSTVAAAATALSSGLDGGRQQGIHYTSPTVAGFIMAASYFHNGGDFDADDNNDPDNDGDGWDVALRYAGEFGSVRVAAGVGYRVVEQGPLVAGEVETLVASASIMHTPTGLFLNGGYGDTDGLTAATSGTAWNVQAGIEQKWFSIGKTTIAANYGAEEADNNREGTYYGLGVTQNIDATATDLYLTWQSYENDPAVGASVESDVVQAGMRVRF